MEWVYSAIPTVIASVGVAVLGYIAREVKTIAMLPHKIERLETEMRADIREIKAELRRIVAGVTS